jgi:hypothetical protein
MTHISECIGIKQGFQTIPDDEEVELMQALLRKWNGKKLPEDWLIDKTRD